MADDDTGEPASDGDPDGDVSYEQLDVDPDLYPRGSHEATRRWDTAIVVGIGGALGGAARHGLNLLWPTLPGSFPWSTFVENVSGCFLLGALMVYLVEVLKPHRYARPLVGIGVLGGFTTFSAYTAQTDALVRADQGPLALAYLFGTLVVALTATWIGQALARSAANLTHPGHRSEVTP